jgi:hypothetical protein
MIKVRGQQGWVYINHPFGFDPYDSQRTSYLYNQSMTTLRAVKEQISERDMPRAALEQSATPVAPAPSNIDLVLGAS